MISVPLKINGLGICVEIFLLQMFEALGILCFFHAPPAAL